jgi:large subunit ribosomal protein L10e
MPVRPARCYKRIKGPPYTREEYIHGAPMIQIPKFDMGTTSAAARAAFSMVAKLVVEERGQIRMQALEAARQMASKYLTKYVGDANYYMRLDSVPHHVLRENRMLAMAGADRLQEGMRLAFGSPAGRAAREWSRARSYSTSSSSRSTSAHVKEALETRRLEAAASHADNSRA